MQMREEEMQPLPKAELAARLAALAAQEGGQDIAGQRRELKEAAYEKANEEGIGNLMAKLERELLQSKPIQKGQRMYNFFSTTQYHRKRGMPITEYCLQWQKAICRKWKSTLIQMSMDGSS